MRTSVTLAGYAAALALLTAGAFAVGAVVGPAASPSATAPAGGPAGRGRPTGRAGLQRQRLPARARRPGAARRRRDRAPLPDHRAARAPVTAFDIEHTQRMHLILERRDTTGFQHRHPAMDPDGTWRTPLPLPAPGSYRAFADFTPTGGAPLTRGVDLAAPGDQTPVRLHPRAPRRSAATGCGWTASWRPGRPRRSP